MQLILAWEQSGVCCSVSNHRLLTQAQPVSLQSMARRYPLCWIRYRHPHMVDDARRDARVIPFRLLTILLPFLVVCAPGMVLWWCQPAPATPTQSQSSRLIFVGRMVTLLVSAAILFNAVYWPFYKQDTLGIYADQAHFMYATGGLIPLNLTFYSYYQAYPMLVQLSYTYSYLASGWEDPYLAKLIPTLLSLACLGAVYYLAKTLYDEKSGWLAVLLFALTPLFGRWASSGYTDLPMAFYYTLAALFVWRTWVSGNLVDALLWESHSASALGRKTPSCQPLASGSC